MKTEIEVKFLNIDHDELRKLLLLNGGKCVTKLRLMKRAIIDYPDRRLQKKPSNSYIRVRDEGDKTTLTYKKFDSLSVDGAKEIETIVKSFEDTVNIFTAIGLEVESLQESRRETWEIMGSKVELDEWPWLDPYIEIEGPSEGHIRKVSAKLGLDWDKGVFGDVMVAYRAQYPTLSLDDTVGNISEVKFGSPLPSLFK
jgi:adenylate cyclase class 2